MREFVVFYAWQSDTLQRHNRFLIRIALEEAARRISKDFAIATVVRIDSDTQGVLGQPPVTETILKKIDACDVFAPDFTFVAATEGGKLVPNPNVMLEYGYAVRSRSYSVMMPVMNTAHGPPEDLPFDMGHLRHPMTYHLEPTATKSERRGVRKNLSDEFENVLRAMIAVTPAKQKDEKPFAEAKAVTPPAFFFEPGDILAEFGLFEEERQRYRFDSDKAIFLRLFPALSGQPAVGRAKVKAIFDARKPCPMSRTFGGLTDHNSHGSIVFDPLGTSTMAGLTQGFPSGELWGLNSQLFRREAGNVFANSPTDYIDMINVEKLFVLTLQNYVRIAINEYQLRPPFVMKAGGIGLLKVRVALPTANYPNGEFVGLFRSASFENRYILDDIQPQQILDVLRQFFDELYDFAACSRGDLLTDVFVTANQLPPRN